MREELNSDNGNTCLIFHHNLTNEERNQFINHIPNIPEELRVSNIIYLEDITSIDKNCGDGKALMQVLIDLVTNQGYENIVFCANSVYTNELTDNGIIEFSAEENYPKLIRFYQQFEAIHIHENAPVKSFMYIPLK